MIAIAVVVLVIFLSIVLYRLFMLLADVQLIVNDTSKRVDTLLQEVNGTVNEVNSLLEDVNEKIKKVDPLFVAVGEVSETISDINTSGRKLFVRKKSIRPKRKRASISAFIAIELAKRIFSKKKNK
ncbi:DUF948 domain-containing protein [Lactococcus lactis]|uniref:DUF948 domain-containing protein n=1 Tax=Lactococcus lactis TaxID=1358 RepID=A0A9X4S4B9_9LACT|nr:DUF948 domain-containing protein [Lactococcus lactis]MDG4983855.1 DUF948 domain-containing protein [Lactococcus lactis]